MSKLVYQAYSIEKYTIFKKKKKKKKKKKTRIQQLSRASHGLATSNNKTQNISLLPCEKK